MSLASIVLWKASAPAMRIPAPEAKPLMARPRTVTPEPVMVRPSLMPASRPSSSISGVPE